MRCVSQQSHYTRRTTRYYATRRGRRILWYDRDPRVHYVILVNCITRMDTRVDFELIEFRRTRKSCNFLLSFRSENSETRHLCSNSAPTLQRLCINSAPTLQLVTQLSRKSRAARQPHRRLNVVSADVFLTYVAISRLSTRIKLSKAGCTTTNRNALTRRALI